MSAFPRLRETALKISQTTTIPMTVQIRKIAMWISNVATKFHLKDSMRAPYCLDGNFT